MSNKEEYLKELIDSCFLPELKQDLDNVPIQIDHFEKYHELLRQQLPLLYDLLQQDENLLLNSKENAERQQLFGLLIVLLCELTADNTIFRLNAINLVNNAEHLLKRYFPLPHTIEESIFKYYQNKLHKERWKRQLGAVHGLVQYLKFRYSDKSICDDKNFMDISWINFCLAIGLNIRECVEPEYKQLGVRIFIEILEHSRLSEIRELNVHSVIYEDVSKDVYSMDSITSTSDIWNCLCKCLDKYKDIDSFTWNQCDDMLERLISNVSLAPSADLSICLLRFITKLGYYFTINREELGFKLENGFNDTVLIDDCRFACESNTSYTSFRWAKSILEMFLLESHKLLGSPNHCRMLLLELHRCYLICILPIPLQVIYPHLLGFYEKFTSVLMQVVTTYKGNEQITEMVHEFIRSFYLQLQRSPYCDDKEELRKFRNAFEQLLKCVFYTNQ